MYTDCIIGCMSYPATVRHLKHPAGRGQPDLSEVIKLEPVLRGIDAHNVCCVHIFTMDGVYLVVTTHNELKQPCGLCSPLRVNMSPHLVGMVRRRETLTGLHIIMLIKMALFLR